MGSLWEKQGGTIRLTQSVRKYVIRSSRRKTNQLCEDNTWLASFLTKHCVLACWQQSFSQYPPGLTDIVIGRRDRFSE